MSITKFVLIVTALVGATPFAWGQKPEGASPHGILGYLDSRTGAFKPAIQTPVESDQAFGALASVSPSTGKLVFNFTINVVSAFPSNAVITCTATAQTMEMTPTFTVGTSVVEAAATVATRSGSKAACTVTIPYSWSLTTAGADSVTLGTTITAYSGTTLLRESMVSLPTIKVPATGSTTNQTIGATI